MLAHGNDVKLPRDQEPLYPDAAPVPAKPWRHRVVLMAVMTGIVAILVTVAICGNGKNWHNIRSDHTHIQLLKLYAQMQYKSSNRWVLVKDMDFSEMGCSKKCTIAFDKQKLQVAKEWGLLEEA